MRKKALQVTLDVREPSVVELTVGDRVQLDRIARSPHGHVAERHGNLLERGAATLSLEPGFYFFKTLSDANLKVIRGGVGATTSAIENKDDPPPDPPKVGGPPQPPARGDDAPGEAPVLTIE